MNLQQLSTFCKVLSEGSMTGAAQKLFLTQPAVSQQIRGLEDELGVMLLVRGVRQVKPTLQGQLLYDYAKRILNLTQQAEVAIQTISQEIEGHLVVGTTNSFGLHLISPIIGLFLKHNTRLSIKLIYGSANEIIKEMRDGVVDVAVLPELKEEYGIEFDHFDSQFLMRDEMLLVASGKDVSIPNKIASLSDFLTKPIVVNSSSNPRFKKTMDQAFGKLKQELLPVFESDNIGTLKRVIESGLGWGFLPSHSVRKQVRTRRLNHVQVDGFEHSVNIHFYSRKGKDLSTMAGVFYRALQQQSLI